MNTYVEEMYLDNVNKVFMIKFLIRTVKYINKFVKIRTNPYVYAQSLGVKLGESVYFYDLKSTVFGSEPWMITIGNNVHITTGCQFITHDGGTLILRDKVPDLELSAPIIIGDNVYIGVNVVILPGVTIGNNVIIGACSVVTKDIQSNSVAAGNPAKIIKSLHSYLEKAKKNSLHLGHLKNEIKDKALKDYFRNKGNV